MTDSCKVCGCKGGVGIEDKWYCANCYEENDIIDYLDNIKHPVTVTVKWKFR